MANRNSRHTNKRNERVKVYAQWVIGISFVVNVIALIITSSPRIAFATFIMGIFFGFLIYTGWYTD